MTPVHAKDLFRGGSLRFREPDRPVAAKVTHAPVVPQRVTPPSIQCGCQRMFGLVIREIPELKQFSSDIIWSNQSVDLGILLEFWRPHASPMQLDDNQLPRFSVTVGGVGAAVGTVPQLLAANFQTFNCGFLCSSMIYIYPLYISILPIFYPFTTKKAWYNKKWEAQFGKKRRSKAHFHSTILAVSLRPKGKGKGKRHLANFLGQIPLKKLTFPSFSSNNHGNYC